MEDLSFLERVGQRLMGSAWQREVEQRDAYAQQATLFQAAWEYSPWRFGERDYQSRVRELDQGAYDWLQQMEGWELIGTMGEQQPREEDRLRAVRYSRYGYNKILLYERMVQMWTDYTIGTSVDVVIESSESDQSDAMPGTSEAQAIWDAFWKSPTNQYVLSQIMFPKQSDFVQIDGEVFWVLFISKLDGAVTIRSLRSTEITEVIYDENDRSIPVLYKRETEDANGATVTRYYRDYRASAKQEKAAFEAEARKNREAILASKEKRNTDVMAIHLWFKGLEGRGWPVQYKAVTWGRDYESFLQDRLALQKALLAGYEDVEVKGGSRNVNAIIARMQSGLVSGSSESNPAPIGPTPFVHNEAMNRRRMPLTSGATDAQTDSMLILAYAGLAGGLPPGWIGRPDMLQNRAVAETLLQPVYKQWERFQLLFIHSLQELATQVLKAATSYPKGNPRTLDEDLETYSASVTLSVSVDTSFKEFVDSVVAAAGTELMLKEDLSAALMRQPEWGIADIEASMSKLYPPEEEEGEPQAARASVSRVPDEMPEDDGDEVEQAEATIRSGMLTEATLGNMSRAEMVAIIKAATHIVARGE